MQIIFMIFFNNQAERTEKPDCGEDAGQGDAVRLAKGKTLASL